MDSEPAEMVTRCGRRLSVGRFRMPTATERVVLRIDAHEGCSETVWASLTPDEATALAQALLAQARAARGHGGGSALGGPASPIHARQVIPHQRPGGRHR